MSLMVLLLIFDVLCQIFRELIATSQELRLDNTYPRDLVLESLEGKVTVCVGVCRCGKSTLMQQRFLLLAEQGVARENMVMPHMHGIRPAGFIRLTVRFGRVRCRVRGAGARCSGAGGNNPGSR